jgi:hypothetical protein
MPKVVRPPASHIRTSFELISFMKEAPRSQFHAMPHDVVSSGRCDGRSASGAPEPKRAVPARLSTARRAFRVAQAVQCIDSAIPAATDAVSEHRYATVRVPERAGSPAAVREERRLHYWLIDPEACVLEALALRDGR